MKPKLTITHNAITGSRVWTFCNKHAVSLTVGHLKALPTVQDALDSVENRRLNEISPSPYEYHEYPPGCAPGFYVR